MGSCPKCNATIDDRQEKCTHCGFVFASSEIKPGSETLNVFEHFSLDEQAPGDAPESPPGGSDNRATPSSVAQYDPDQTVDSVQSLPNADPPVIDHGTAETSMLNEAEIEAASADPEATIDSQMSPAEGDNVGTVVNPLDRQDSSKGTAVYSEHDLREVIEGRTSGTSGKLKRLWDVAAGSSDNPLHTLRGEEALASDSLFRRVATRRLAPANAPSDDAADYIIVDKVGQGGMGIVYSARQTNVNRLVALKAIKSDLQASDDNRRKFFYEAQITADLDHPNIVPIYELGATQDGLLFYAMKLITGTEWKDVIRTNSREENLEILFKINDAMAFAHSKGIVHRDLKPANTMIGPYGEVYVTDWGMAIDTRKKMRFGPGGSPAYMAPEMALHQVDKIGTASDIYILGAMLFQIVTGSPPHPGRTVQETLRSAARNTIVAHDSQDALMSIALRAMSTNIEDRYRTVEEFQEALREYRQHAESIALAKRSDDLLSQAIERSDYDLFSRAVFGYRDAVELWPENQTAQAAQRQAQLEYGKCAIAKGDYDLAMQVLDQNDTQQRALYHQAVKGKQAIADREKRVKNLRRIVVAVVLVGIVVSSSLAAYAWMQRGQAIASAQEAKTEQKNAEAARDLAVTAQQKEEAARMEEQAAKIAAQESAIEAETQRIKADMSAMDAEERRKQAVAAQMKAEDAQKAEFEAKKAAQNAELAAIDARNAAIKAAAQIKLEEYKAALPLAKSQLESFDVRAARATLKESAVLTSRNLEGQSSVFIRDNVVKQPKSDTWPWKRVNLLSNVDLPKEQLASGATALDYAPAMQLAVVGTRTGQVNLITLADGTPKTLATHSEPDAMIEGVAISPKGDEVVFSFKQNKENGGHGFRAWAISSSGSVSQPVAVGVKANYALQGFAYSQDGNYIIAGVDKGIWMWQRKAKWYEGKEDAQFKNLRGRLKSIAMLDGNRALIATQVNGYLDETLTLYTVNLADKNSSRKVELGADFESQLSAVNYDSVAQQLIFGTSDGQLYAASLENSARPTTSSPRLTSTSPQEDQFDPLRYSLTNVQLIVPKEHRTAVENIVLATSGEMLTTGAEPVMHVWQRDADKRWVYDTYLTGTAANLTQAVFVDAGKVMGIDASGLSMVWDIQQQKRRRQLVRQSPGGLPEKYEEPVIGAFTTNDGFTIAVDAKGRIERWESLTGKTVQFDDQRWLYAGHTPGASFVDLAVDVQAGIVATAARLDNVSSLYLQPDDGQWEFCVWNQADGTLLNRWRSQKETSPTGDNSAQNSLAQGEVEQRLSLVDNGRALILASDNQTRLVSLAGEELFSTEDFGTYFAVPNPTAPNQLMLVMRSGSLAILDLHHLDQWSEAPRQYALTVTRDTPQQGIWSPDGRHFYLTFNSGAVAQAGWDGQQLKLLWSSHSLEGQRDTVALERALAQSMRVKSHVDIDLTVRQSDGHDRLYIARRTSGNTSLMALDFQVGKVPQLIESAARQVRNISWLDDSGVEPVLSERLHPKLRVDNRQISARVRVKDQIYISTHAASVFRLQTNSGDFESYGREQIASVSASRDAKLIIALFADGALKKFELDDWRNVWKPCGYSAVGYRQARLSPDGTQLGLIGQANGSPMVRVIDVATGAEILSLPGAANLAWDMQADASGAICYADGKIETFTGSNRQAHSASALVSQAQVVNVQYLIENWSDSNLAAVKHLMVHTETAEAGQIQFVPLDGSTSSTRDFNELEKLEKGVQVSVSPTEGVLVTGDQSGTVKLWFASPSWDSKPKELFELEGHRGARIVLATFSQDGKTLLSTDSKNRVYGWLSDDQSN